MNFINYVCNIICFLSLEFMFVVCYNEKGYLNLRGIIYGYERTIFTNCKKYDIDEAWVNFDEALDSHHVDDGETYLIYKKSVQVGDRDLSCANYAIMEIFAPELITADVYDPIESDSVHLGYMIVPDLDEDRVANFEKIKKNGFRLLYSKGDGLVG